jgi:hypothetical protein
VLCFPLKNVVFLLRPAERLANKATDRLPSCEVKVVAGLNDFSDCWLPKLESLFCRLNRLLPRLLASVKIDPLFLACVVYDSIYQRVSKGKFVHHIPLVHLPS